MSTIVKAAAVQISPVLYSRQGTVEKVVKKIGELGERGVQFATLPETVIPYYPYFSFVQPPFQMGKEYQRLLEESVTVPSAETLAIGEAAKQANMVVSIGVNERDGGSIYNTQLLFDADGTLIQRRRKLTPTYHERMIWGQGDGSGLRLTTAKYYTPKGRSIQSTGISPDIVVKVQPTTVAKAGEGKSAEKEGDAKTAQPPAAKDQPASNGKPAEDGTKNGTPPNPSFDVAGELSLEQDVQLQKAVELLKSWKIFKGLPQAQS